MAGEEFIFKASFNSTSAAVANLQKQIDEAIVAAAAVGDEAHVALLKARKLALGTPESFGVQAPQVEATNVALQNQKKLLAENVQLELEGLAAIEAQLAAQTAMRTVLEGEAAARAAASAEATKASLAPGQLPMFGAGGKPTYPTEATRPPLIVPTGRTYTDYEQTLGRQVAREREMAQYAAQVAARLAEQKALLESMSHQAGVAYGASAGYGAGQEAAAAGVLVPTAQRQAMIAGPVGGAGAWTAAEKELVAYNITLGEYDAFAANAGLATNALSADLTRLGIAQSQSSMLMRQHGALTTEWLGALTRGETTISEIGYQMGATIGKFAGWTLAAGATYGALGALVELGKGAIDTATGVQQLHRTIESFDTNHARQALENLSADANVSMKEAADATFLFSRTFHNVDDAVLIAGRALKAYKLDGVSVADQVKAATALNQQFGLSAQQLVPIWDMLAAGQQKYNARVNEAIPMLQRSTGAIKNAGGDLNEYMKIVTIALRTTQLTGTQLGTMFQRAAANYLNPATPKGQKDLASLQGMGIDTSVLTRPGAGGITTLFEEMLRRSEKLTNAQRQQMAIDFGGTGFGGRAASLWAGGGAALLDPVSKTMAKSRGTLDEEFAKEVSTVREDLKKLVVGVQQLGSALSGTAMLTPFGLAIKGIAGSMHELRGLIDLFDTLPHGAKQAASALLEFRLAMLFLQRTSVGASVADKTGLSLIGLGPSAATRERKELQVGTRAILDQLGQDVAQTSARSLSTGNQRLTLERKRAQVEAEIASSGEATKAQMARSNELNAQIEKLKADGLKIQAELNAQLEAQAMMTKQSVGLSSITRRTKWPDTQVRTLYADTLGGTVGAEEEGAAAGRDTAAQGRFARAKLAAARVIGLNTTASKAAAGALGAEGAAATAGGLAADGVIAEATVARTGILGMGQKLMGMAAALDPLLVAIIGVPLAISEIKKISDGLSHATDQASTGVSSLQGLKGLTHQHYSTVNPWDAFGYGDARDAVNDARQKQSDLANAVLAAREHTLASPVQQVGYSLGELTNETDADVKAFKAHKITRQEFNRRMDELGRSAGSSMEALTGAKHADAAVALFRDDVKNKLGQAIQDTAKGAKDFFDGLDALSDDALKGQVEGFSSRADVFGLKGGDLTKAGETYLFLAARMRNSQDPKQLQQVRQAETAFTTAIDKNVKDFLSAAEGAGSFRAQEGDIGQAISTINQIKQKVQVWVQAMDKKFAKYPSIIAAVQAAAGVIEANLNDQLKTAIDQDLAAIKTNTDLIASQITGKSPEADIARAEVELAGLRTQLAKAQADHAKWSVIGGLLWQINTAQNALVQQKIDNARAILDASGQLATAAITGIGPGADIARAQQDVTNAQNLLAYDQAHGAGQAAIIQDQVALDNSVRTLNEQIQSRDQQLHQDLANYISAQGALAQSLTTDPVKQAQEQLATDIKLLAGINRSDYKTEQEYLTAVMQAKAKVNQDRTKVSDQIVNQDLATLSFEQHTQKIGDQAYINGLEQILKTKKLSLAQRQQILSQIYDLKQGLGKDLELNVGSIKLPSVYQIRRAIGLGRQGELPGAQGTVINHSAAVTVNVYGRGDVAAVGRVLDEHLNTSVRASMRAKGVI